jgi:hypothetical protein
MTIGAMMAPYIHIVPSYRAGINVGDLLCTLEK